MSSKNELDVYLFHRGEHKRAYEFMGAHSIPGGIIFRVWAPNARSVSIVGNFNSWNGRGHSMRKINDEGIWELEVEGLSEGEIYKYAIEDQNGTIVNKSDPYAFLSELRPDTASVVYPPKPYEWTDEKWIKKRDKLNHYENPMNIYEVHLGSWKRGADGGFLNYREMADDLAKYVKNMGYTHVEIMPVGEYPLDASWGYQGTGYYSVTRRYGRPEDLKYFVDILHSKNIGVILDWVPGHFCKDTHGLYRFDGTPTYEYSWNLLGENYDWGTANFDLGRNEVKSFLISNALYWMREFHIDGLRIDAVANMIYLDYGKNGHPELRNEYGGNENLVAVDFLRGVNKAVLEEFPGNYVFAEESTAWPMVTKPDYVGGLGFTYKWNMGWMNDTLDYMSKDSLYKKWHHENITFSFVYAYAENYTLPLSHDEVVHGKRSLIDKMPGSYEEKFPNLRCLYGYMMGTPGKKLLFMGGEFGQFAEWKFAEGLDWHLLDYPKHKELKRYVRDLNRFYKREKSLWEKDIHGDGFQWIDCLNHEESIISFIRRGKAKDEFLIGVFNFTPVERRSYKVGVPRFAIYDEVFNSDLKIYGGNTEKHREDIHPIREEWNDMKQHILIDVPPLSAVYYKGKFKRRG